MNIVIIENVSDIQTRLLFTEDVNYDVENNFILSLLQKVYVASFCLEELHFCEFKHIISKFLS